MVNVTKHYKQLKTSSARISSNRWQQIPMILCARLAKSLNRPFPARDHMSWQQACGGQGTVATTRVLLCLTSERHIQILKTTLLYFID